MSDRYYYYYPQTAPAEHTGEGSQQWNSWSAQQEQYSHDYLRNTTSTYNSPDHDHRSNLPSGRPQSYHPSSQGTNGSRLYQPRRYNNYQNPYYGNRQQNWQRNQRFKRSRTDSGTALEETRSKSAKKKKKPLSQNIPSKKDWTPQEAEMALAVEKECNKRFKSVSLLIKFPDLELNKDIVAKFHSSIENVHFQQPSAPRFCFVTLKESADPDTVINQLNKQRFGEGYITAEYKKDREEDQNVGPDDIDPLTLYVGNLAQDITKEDMVKTYPKVRRIDIGYAKKMKYTRYAFVSFSTVPDAIEAFKKTHHTEMYSKSLIVRFRRLHGPVGMPGESKQQNPPKTKDKTSAVSVEQNGHENSLEPEHGNTEDLSLSFAESLSPMDLAHIKEEPDFSDDESVEDLKARIFSNYERFSAEAMPTSKTDANGTNTLTQDSMPRIKQELSEDVTARIKPEPDQDRNGNSKPSESNEERNTSNNLDVNPVKEEPVDDDSDFDESDSQFLRVENYDTVYSSFVAEAKNYRRGNVETPIP